MSVFTSLGILLVAMFIQGFLQTSPAVFAIFYHHALGKTSAKKADDQSLSFILGTEFFTAIIFLAIYFLVAYLDATINYNYAILMWVMGGIFVLEAIVAFFFYFRPGKKSRKTTRLFLPRKIAKGLETRTGKTKNRSDTILLGFLTAATELIFTLPLYIISAIQIVRLASRFSPFFIIAYIVITTLPLFIVRILYRTHHNLAEIQRRRIKKKLFFKIIIALGFAILSALSITTGVFL
ncbi:MAG: hypothetical protein Q4F58_02605 [Candidatus Saccharibacteria bacterium]|nr:hypothetical protein [Candidatus Saccharibacteria bacterium]